MKKKVIALLLAAAMAMSLTACGDTSKTGSTAEETAKQEETTKESENTEKAEESTLVYGSGDYTRINPAMDELKINEEIYKTLPDFPKFAITYSVSENDEASQVNQEKMVMVGS